jgi:hypothetical protein
MNQRVPYLDIGCNTSRKSPELCGLHHGLRWNLPVADGQDAKAEAAETAKMLLITHFDRGTNREPPYTVRGDGLR